MQYFLRIAEDKNTTDCKYYYPIQKDSSTTTSRTPKTNSNKTSGDEANIGYYLDVSPNSPYLIAGSALHTIMNQNVSRIIIYYNIQ